MPAICSSRHYPVKCWKSVYWFAIAATDDPGCCIVNGHQEVPGIFFAS